jgi:methylated-DNA-protein-cysteine methyltransferase related protein
MCTDEVSGPGGARRQAIALRREGVQVRDGPMGDYSIDIVQFGWFPDILPSEEAEDEDESVSEREEESLLVSDEGS